MKASVRSATFSWLDGRKHDTNNLEYYINLRFDKKGIAMKIAFDGSAFWETGMTYEEQYDVVARAG